MRAVAVNRDVSLPALTMSGHQPSEATARAVVAPFNSNLIVTTHALVAEHRVKCPSPLTCRDFPADTSLAISYGIRDPVTGNG